MWGLNKLPKNLRDAANIALQPGERILYAAHAEATIRDKAGWH